MTKHIRLDDDDIKIHPIHTAWYTSIFTFSWVWPLIQLGNRRQLTPNDVWPLEKSNNIDIITNRFLKTYKTTNNIWYIFLKLHWFHYIILGLLELIVVLCDLFGPGYVLEHIIKEVELPHNEFDTNYVLKLIGSLFFIQLIGSFTKVHLAYQRDILSIRFASGIQNLIFQKSLILSSNSKKIKSTGDVSNLLSIDIQNILLLIHHSHQLWIVPIQLIIVLYLLHQIVGWSIFMGLCGILIILIINSILGISMSYIEENILKYKDERMKILNELLNGIQIIKLNNWENNFKLKIYNIRLNELKNIWILIQILSWIIAFMECTPIIIMIIVFGTMTYWMHQVISVSIVFSTVALFAMLQAPLIAIPALLLAIVQSTVSTNRINELLDMNETDGLPLSNVKLPIGMINLKNVTFSWEPEPPIFNMINLKIEPGEFVILHGNVGQGKSSLLAGLVGEMKLDNGLIDINGRIAYVAQQPWIQNGTIRDNILFGEIYEEERYYKVIEACGLKNDFIILPSGDTTEIGLRGINISGGQKARIALARAVYSDADIYLLDAPLAAVDTGVSGLIFNNCILGLLQSKTILFVTHNHDFITSPHVTRTICIQNGQLLEGVIDTINETTPLIPVVTIETSPTIKEDITNENTSNGSITVEEERAQGRVSMDVLWAYINAMGGWPILIGLILLTCLSEGIKLSGDMWLAFWGDESKIMSSNDFHSSSHTFMGVYFFIGVISCVTSFLVVVSVLGIGLRASQFFFLGMLNSILTAPLRFFDSNPSGRLLNRFGDDVTLCDIDISMSFVMLLTYSLSTLFKLILAIVLTKWFGIVILPLLYIFLTLASIYLLPMREVNRIERTCVSPLLTLVCESMDGVITIRASNKMNYIFNRCKKRLELLCSSLLVRSAVNQWFLLRMEITSCTIVVVILLAIVILHESLSPGIVGLLATYGLGIPSRLSSVIIMWSKLETDLVGPERIYEYMNIESEKINSINHHHDEDDDDDDTTSPWPSQGTLLFQNVYFNYKTNSPMILRGVTFDAKGGEKIGVVGRTGAGKSSLLMALFRMNELIDGKIFIDGIDIATIDLYKLRRGLAIIPQTPILFRGTLRYQLDPFEQYNDTDIWECLKKVQLHQRVLTMEKKLESKIDENGTNLSVGERQMLCMARALLRQAKIVVLDEATASIDRTTDRLLQQVIKEAFLNSTVITIAHRLDTILYSDRIVVMDHGMVVQYDTPQNLINLRSGIFYELLQHGGYECIQEKNFEKNLNYNKIMIEKKEFFEKKNENCILITI